ncbi:MAG: MFS transporter [Mariniphaga sp.]|nr:MFS transporter [Mariniphaga sp.]
MKKKLHNLLTPFTALKNRLFARLYLAQTVSLLGDAFTWVGIALLAFELGGTHSARILATALTLRVIAFIIFGSYAGVIADRFDRKKIMIITHLSRMIIVGLFPFVSAEWQLYVLIFLLNIFNAFFTPAYRAAIPQLVSKKEDFANAIVLSNATWQLLGVLGPGLAGGMAVFMGVRQIFFFDAASFIVAAVLIILIPGTLLVKKKPAVKVSIIITFSKDMLLGTKLLFKKRPIRFALFIELVAAIAGAHILVNTIGHIKGDLHLTDVHYGWIMAAFGIGATIAAFTTNSVDKSKNKTRVLILGAAMIALSVTMANFVPYAVLVLLWVMAGLGQSYTEMPSQILIAENTELSQQGRVYGAHFAWSHLWWAIGYPIAGFTGTNFGNNDFLIGGLLSLFLLIVLCSYEYHFRKNLS